MSSTVDNFLGVGKKAKARRELKRSNKAVVKPASQSKDFVLKPITATQALKPSYTAPLPAGKMESPVNSPLPLTGAIETPLYDENGQAAGQMDWGSDTDGKFNRVQTGEDVQVNATRKSKKNNTLIYIIAAVVIIAGIIYFKQNKK